ncbi:MAG: insulinase family protein [Oligoflexia bacterium]|nr:insulinase family protein [Oligoflexia bacterium]
MKKIVLLVCFLSLSCAHGPTGQSIDSGYRLPKYTDETLSNGLQVVVVPNDRYPTVSVALLVKGGASTDPMAKSGVSHLLFQVMQRGTTKYSASEIADRLGQTGTDLDVAMTEDYGWIQISGLSQYQSEIIEIFTDVVLSPSLLQNELERERKKTLAILQKRTEDPDSFAAEAFENFLFGDHPYGRTVSGRPRDVSQISVADLKNAHQRLFRPENLILVVTGDVSDETKKSLTERFGTWKQNGQAPAFFPKVKGPEGVAVRLVHKPGMTQSYLVLGHLGIKRTNPDFIKLRVANTVLGGGFSSRLMNRVRVQLGLTYGVSSQFEARKEQGEFQVSTFTRNQTVKQTIDETLGVLEKFAVEGPTDEEVEMAKNYLMGQFPRSVETAEKLGFNLAVLRLYGVSDDYLKDYMKTVSRVSKKDVVEVAKTYIHPKNLKILVFGDQKAVSDQLKAVGSFEVLEPEKAF